ncbi:MAG: aminotransferase class I/II-fold pyridoxal phosphate-dependent enzyme [Candidatus Eremiobacteraeota bacterium]|nr:aminotransferase class I/II-fold pyridoxal phosphate-dependent enzyme [Candidatus Eremiobacteraeota bacterium]
MGPARARRGADPFDAISLETLRARRSEKWATYPADVLPAWVAETDFPLAPAVRAAIEAALDHDDCGYASAQGLGPAFRRYAQAVWRWPPDEPGIFAVPDVMAGITQVMLLTTAPGDRVVINPPVYPPFFETIRSAGRNIEEVPLRRTDGDPSWHLDFDALEDAFSRGSRAYLLCHPHNPVGRIWPKPDLERIATLARHYDVAVISDEIHAPLAMPEQPFVPFLSLEQRPARSAALHSASKAWNVAGLKCGLLVAGSTEFASDIEARLSAIPTEIISRVGHLGVLASIAAFDSGFDWLEALRVHLDRNRRLLAQLLREHIPSVGYALPEAGYLAWLDCRALGVGPDPARHFLKRGKVALARGLDFGAQGAGFARLNMGTSSALLREIVSRMKAALV